MSYKLDFYKSDVSTTAEASPNASAPSAARIIRSPRHEEAGYAVFLWVGDGTSLGVTIWFRDDTSTLWIPLTTGLSVNFNESQFVIVPPDAELFFQLTLNTGTVTKFGASFIGVAAATSLAASGRIPLTDVLGNQNMTLGRPLHSDIDSVLTRPRKPISFSTAVPNTGEVARLVSSVGGSQLINVWGRNRNAAARFLQVHNLAASPPSGGAVPLESRNVALTSAGEIILPVGREFSTGIVVAFSTTEDTYTAPTAGDHWFTGSYYP